MTFIMNEVQKQAWKLSDTLAKTIEYLHKTDLNETTRRKMIRDILKDNLINFYSIMSNTKATEEAKTGLITKS